MAQPAGRGSACLARLPGGPSLVRTRPGCTIGRAPSHGARWGRPGVETDMNEDALNVSVRKFLKKLGVTAQREIEKAVREAVSSGRLKGRDALPAKATVQ